MRLLVIGAGGFLGGHVRRRACAAGMAVVTAGRSALVDSPGHQTLDLSVDDPARIAAALMSVAPDVVVNCAGATSGDPDVMAAVNITGTYALTMAMLLAGVSARLVHVGSAAEYGCSDPGVAVTESAPPRPVGVYGATKLAGTRLVQLARAAGLDSVVLRVFNPVGPGAPEQSLPGRLVAELRRAMSDGSDVRLGSLDAVRDFVDARDVADAVIAAAAAPILSHSVLNIGSGSGVPVRALVEELVAISGCTSSVYEDSEGSARSASVPWQQADIACAKRDLGWQPRRDLATSLSDWWQEAS
jgi:nucleoside-diphosphate-sugar epimerase